MPIFVQFDWSNLLERENILSDRAGRRRTFLGLAPSQKCYHVRYALTDRPIMSSSPKEGETKLSIGHISFAW